MMTFESKLYWSLANVVPILGAVAFISAMFPEDSAFWKYIFVLAFNAIFVTVVLSIFTKISSKGIHALVLRFSKYAGRRIAAWYREAYHALFDNPIGRFIQYLMGAFSLVFVFFFAKSIDIPEMLKATWDIICAIPRYIRDVNMLSALIRTWLKTTGLDYFLSFAKTIVEKMNVASNEGEFYFVVILFVVGMVVLLLIALGVKFVGAFVRELFSGRPQDSKKNEAGYQAINIEEDEHSAGSAQQDPAGTTDSRRRSSRHSNKPVA